MAELNPDEEPQVEILSSAAEVFDKADGPGNPETPALTPEAAAEIKEWKKKHDEVKDNLLWVSADFDNFKKRALKEKEEDLKFSQAKLLKEMLTVADNLERAVSALPPGDSDKGFLSLKQGVELTLKQFQAVMEKHGVTKIKALGVKFDPRFHEVMFQEVTDQFPDDTVMEELQSGYLLQERVLRPALVKVAKNKPTVDS
jgi:molecular chaperone GrpE